jgi:SDR family mycofactocin-dependent oxidoreductase
MPGRVQGKVALVTGAARGQGRSHALRLAEEGADIIAVDIASQIASVPYAMSTMDDLAETARQVEALDRRIVAAQADVRDWASLKNAVDDGVTQLGRLDIVSVNAGIFSSGTLEELTDEAWNDMMAVNLTGVWHTIKATAPHIRASGRGGSIILTSSTAGLRGMEHIGHYVAAKHGVAGIMRTAALELAKDSIRVNSVHPTSVNTDMIHNAATYQLFAPELPESERTKDVLATRFQATNVLPVPWVESVDISNAVLWLASDESRYVTGLQLTVDAGQMLR